MKKDDDSVRYIGVTEIAQYEYATLKNMWELITEANSLFQINHFARAFNLAYFSIEENAKITLFSFLVLDAFFGKQWSFQEIVGIFKGPLFSNHKKKMRLAFLKLPGYDYQKSVKTISALVELKNRSLYTDLFDGKMCKPSDFFSSKEAKTFIDIATTTFYKRLEELNVKNMDQLNEGLIQAQFEKMERNLSAQSTIMKLKIQQNIAHSNPSYELLTTIISNEDLFNQYKSTYTAV
jgi:AbiV family abortive infection protein